MPNAFSPNGDGKNEEFRPVTLPEKISSFNMYIFIRWGQITFQPATSASAGTGRMRGNRRRLVFTHAL